MKKKVVFEDTVSVYNKWVSGQASREFSAIKMKFNDLLSDDKGNNTQSPNDARANNVLPYPLPNTASILGDLITNTTNAIGVYKNALKNPLVREDEQARREIENIVICLKKSLIELRGIFKIISDEAEKQA